MATGSLPLRYKKVKFKCPRGPDHDGPCYDIYNMLNKALNGYMNKYDFPQVLYDAPLEASLGTLSANSEPFFLTVNDSLGNACGGWSVTALNYVAAPTSGGLLLDLQLNKPLLILPGYSINSSQNITATIINCATLEDALALTN